MNKILQIKARSASRFRQSQSNIRIPVQLEGENTTHLPNFPSMHFVVSKPESMCGAQLPLTCCETRWDPDPHIVKHCGANLPHFVSQLRQHWGKLPHILSVGYQGIAPTLPHLCIFFHALTSQAGKLHTPLSVINNTTPPFLLDVLCQFSNTGFRRISGAGYKTLQFKNTYKM